MSDERRSDASTVCGKTRTRAPRWRIARTMFDFRPRSTIPIRGPASPGDSISVTAGGETWPDEVLLLPTRHRPGGGHGGIGVGRAGCRDDGPQAAVGAQVAGKRTSVDARDRRDVMPAEERCELACILEHGGRGIGDDERRAATVAVIGRPRRSRP